MVLSRSVYAATCVCAMVWATGLAEAAPLQIFQNRAAKAVIESRRLGPVSGMARLNLAVGLPLRNREDLDRFLEQLSDPGSPDYRRYLSASEFAQRFGPSQADYDKLTEFFQANGLAVSGTYQNRMILDVTGPVSAINKTLHVNVTMWEHPTRGRFFAPEGDPSLDVDVAVLDISGLDNFVVARPMDLKTMPLASARPMTTGSGPAGLFFGGDFRAAYAPSVTLTGAGQTVGLFELDGFYAADVTSNFQQAGLPAVPVSTVLLDGFSGAPGNENIEVILDIMMAGFMAPGANIIVYEGTNWNDVLNRMASDNIAKQLSCSWMFSPINAVTEQIFSEMIAQGQSFFTAAGDSGAYSGGTWPPSDDPNVTSVGGTALTTTGPGGAWVSETTWNDGGGGVSTTYAIPSYQQSINMTAIGGSTTMRNVPDVALLAAVQIFLICNNGEWIEVGGTSAATPLWAGFMALANQQAAANGKPPVGFLNPTVYSLGQGADYTNDLHDITTGSNGFAAVTGFDLATGWGTPAGQSLINDLTAMPSTAVVRAFRRTHLRNGAGGVQRIGRDSYHAAERLFRRRYPERIGTSQRRHRNIWRGECQRQPVHPDRRERSRARHVRSVGQRRFRNPHRGHGSEPAGDGSRELQSADDAGSVDHRRRRHGHRQHNRRTCKRVQQRSEPDRLRTAQWCDGVVQPGQHRNREHVELHRQRQRGLGHHHGDAYG